MRSRLPAAILVVAPFATLLTSFALAVVQGASATADATEVATSTSVAQCRAWGFEPQHLACSTCNVLPTLFHDECRQCCQSWLDTKHISKPYEAAVLVDRGGMTPELSSFLEEDWKDVVQAKSSGKEDRLRKMEQRSKIGGRSSQGGSFLSAMAYHPSTILFFNGVTEAKGKDVDVLTTNAAEVVVLDGMKRDDIKNMLLALLP